jgi:zinc transporter ZupT
LAASPKYPHSQSIVQQLFSKKTYQFVVQCNFQTLRAPRLRTGFELELSISYRRAGSTLPKAVRVAAFFSSMTPLGILAGTAVEALVSSGGRLLFEAIFDSVGAGTFLYIASVDIVRAEFEPRGDRWQKWLLATLGFSMMAGLALWM